MNGALLILIGLVLMLADLAIGFAISRRAGDRAETRPDGSVGPVVDARAGRLVMLLAPIMFLIFAALAFGLIPVDGIDPIRFN